MLVLWLCLHWETLSEKPLVYSSEKKQALVYYLELYKCKETNIILIMVIIG